MGSDDVVMPLLPFVVKLNDSSLRQTAFPSALCVPWHEHCSAKMGQKNEEGDASRGPFGCIVFHAGSKKEGGQMPHVTRPPFSDTFQHSVIRVTHIR